MPLLAVPPTAAEMKDGTWIVSGSCVHKDAVVVKENYGFSLDRLQVSLHSRFKERTSFYFYRKTFFSNSDNRWDIH